MLPAASMVGPDRGPILGQPVQPSMPFALPPSIEDEVVIQYPLRINEPNASFTTWRLPSKACRRASLEEGYEIVDTPQKARADNVFAAATSIAANPAMDFLEHSTIRWADPYVSTGEHEL